jgi:hypothetical protein
LFVAVGIGFGKFAVRGFNMAVLTDDFGTVLTDDFGTVLTDDGSVVVAEDTTPPSVVAGLTATVLSTSQINLDWVDATDNVAVTDYRVERSTSADFSANLTAVNTGQSVSAWMVTGLTAATTYYFRVKSKDAAGNYSTSWSNAASATTQSVPIPPPPTSTIASMKNVCRVDLIPVSNLGLLYCPTAETFDNAQGVRQMTDFSGNNLHIASANNYPLYGENRLGGKGAIYFNGNNTAFWLNQNLGNFKHIFLVCAHELATFSTFNGILSSNNAGYVVGNAGQTNFVDNGFEAYAEGFEYRKNDRKFTGVQGFAAPMANNFGIIEWQFEDEGQGAPFNGLVIGQNQSNVSQRWRGWFAMLAMYREKLSDCQRFNMYQFLSRNFQIWQENQTGLKVFPFPADFTRSMSDKKRVLESISESGATKSRIKRPSNKEFDAVYNVRNQCEFDAAREFWNAHYPNDSFIFRDYGFYTARDTEVLFASELNHRGSDVARRHDYGFRARQK